MPGWNEHYEDAGDMAAFNTAAQKLALRGVSILASTGDDGVANQRARQEPGFCGFYPSFPASSPYGTLRRVRALAHTVSLSLCSLCTLCTPSLSLSLSLSRRFPAHLARTVRNYVPPLPHSPLPQSSRSARRAALSRTSPQKSSAPRARAATSQAAAASPRSSTARAGRTPPCRRSSPRCVYMSFTVTFHVNPAHHF